MGIDAPGPEPSALACARACTPDAARTAGRPTPAPPQRIRWTRQERGALSAAGGRTTIATGTGSLSSERDRGPGAGWKGAVDVLAHAPVRGTHRRRLE